MEKFLFGSKLKTETHMKQYMYQILMNVYVSKNRY